MKKLIFTILLVCLFTVLYSWILSTTAYAQTGQSNCWVTKVGNPQGQPTLPAGCNSGGGLNTASDVALLANEIVEAAKSEPNCNKAIITANNYLCLKAHMPQLPHDKYPEAAFGQITSSATSYFYYQCVGFVQTVIAGLTNKRLDGGGGAASDYIKNVPTGYQFISNNGTIQPGDIPLWGGGDFGHIAIATWVNPDGNSFKVAEANFTANGQLSNHRIVTKREVAGWLRKK